MGMPLVTGNLAYQTQHLSISHPHHQLLSSVLCCSPNIPAPSPLHNQPSFYSSCRSRFADKQIPSPETTANKPLLAQSQTKDPSSTHITKCLPSTTPWSPVRPSPTSPSVRTGPSKKPVSLSSSASSSSSLSVSLAWSSARRSPLPVPRSKHCQARLVQGLVRQRKARRSVTADGTCMN
ncbi:hypothetical protein FJTKL_12962 [Diaporthe vaccinii]|uniref:Uncharacterized protein n=1 Tax=Diaporthe vaccinii TaxID=105482 RepID=A0ABR4ECF1_9PEZI